MKFNLKDYKLFSKNNVLGFIKHNLTGCVSWKGYTLTSKPDPKLGYNKFDYFLQIPVVGMLGLVCCMAVFIPIIYISIFIQQLKDS